VLLDQQGTVTFRSPDGTPVTDAAPRPTGGSAEPPPDLATANVHRGITITPDTVMPDHLDPLDLDLALTALITPGHWDPYRRR